MKPDCIRTQRHLLTGEAPSLV